MHKSLIACGDTHVRSQTRSRFRVRDHDNKEQSDYSIYSKELFIMSRRALYQIEVHTSRTETQAERHMRQRALHIRIRSPNTLVALQSAERRLRLHVTSREHLQTEHS